MHVALRLLSIASLLIALVGAFFIGGSIYAGFTEGFSAMLRVLIAGIVFTSIGLGAFVGLWILADRRKP